MKRQRDARMTVLLPVLLFTFLFSAGCRRTQDPFPFEFYYPCPEIEFGKHITTEDARTLGFERLELAGGKTKVIQCDAAKARGEKAPGLVWHYLHEKIIRFLPDFRKCEVTVWIYQYDRPLTARHVHTTLHWQTMYSPAHPERWKGTVSIQGTDLEPFWKAFFFPEELKEEYCRGEFTLYFQVESLLLAVKIVQPCGVEDPPSLRELEAEAVRIGEGMVPIVKRVLAKSKNLSRAKVR